MSPRWLPLGVAVGVAALQPHCESSALHLTQARLGPRGSLSNWDLNSRGIWLAEVGLNLGQQRAELTEVYARIAHTGLQVEARGLEVVPTPPQTPATAQPPKTGPSANADTKPRPSREFTWPLSIPLTLSVEQPVELRPVGGLGVRWEAPTLRLRRDAPVDLGGTLWLTHDGRPLVGSTHVRIVASPDRNWTFSGELTSPASGAPAPEPGPAVTWAARTQGSAIEVALRTSAGQAQIHADRTSRTLELQAADFPLAGLTSVLATVLPDNLDLRASHIRGTLQARWDNGLQVRFDDFSLRGAIVTHRRLSPTPVPLAPLRTDGQIRRRGDSWTADLRLTHGAADVTLTAQLDPTRAQLQARVPPLSCQALIESIPGALTGPALEGTMLEGELEASFAVDIDRGQLAQIGQDPDLWAQPRSGTLQLEFPFLDACKTLHDAPAIDLAGLRGPYRHRFSARGRVHDRLLTAHAPGFVELARVPLIAAAFVALEDMGFWRHDGFDRPQIERAFWHNLARSGIYRGASTISQQTARNLWLGVDRSLMRKLQEAYLTTRLEAEVPKRRILELYLNLIELGPGIFGIDQAARHYFGVAPEDLSVLQALHLASLAPAPGTLSRRFVAGQVDAQWLAELRQHARRMQRNGMITQDQFYGALRADLGLLDRRPSISAHSQSW